MNKYKRQAKELKRLRNKAGNSQLALAKACGYDSGQYVSNIERGLCGVSKEMLASLSIIGYDVDKLIICMVDDYKETLEVLVKNAKG